MPTPLAASIRESTESLSEQARRAIAQNFAAMVADSVACDLRRIAAREAKCGS